MSANMSDLAESGVGGIGVGGVIGHRGGLGTLGSSQCLIQPSDHDQCGQDSKSKKDPSHPGESISILGMYYVFLGFFKKKVEKKLVKLFQNLISRIDFFTIIRYD